MSLYDSGGRRVAAHLQQPPDMLDKSRNQRHMDPRLMEPRHMDPRHIDQRSTMDPRLHVPRQFDLRQSSRPVSSSMDPRQLDPRLVSSRNLDPRLYTSSATVAGGGGGRRRQVESDEESEDPVGGFGKGKTILVIAIVAGCFAILWPKIFYPMLFGGPDPPIVDEVRQERPGPGAYRQSGFRPGPGMHVAMQERGRMGAHPGMVGNPGVPPPIRTVEKEWRDRGGPMPGMRPNMGAPGIQAQQQKGSGPMGVIMPIYTVGIIIFFLYTAMKIMFKNKDEDEDEDDGMRTKSKRSGLYDTGYDDYKYSSEAMYEPDAYPSYETKSGYINDLPSPSPYHQDLSTEPAKKVAFTDPLVTPANSSDEVANGPAVAVGDVQRQQPVGEADEDSGKLAAKRTQGSASIFPKVNEAMLSSSSGEPVDPRDAEISLLKRRLEETERAMERIVQQMGAVTQRLSPIILAQAMEGGNQYHCCVPTSQPVVTKEDDTSAATLESKETVSGCDLTGQPIQLDKISEKLETSDIKEIKDNTSGNDDADADDDKDDADFDNRILSDDIKEDGLGCADEDNSINNSASENDSDTDNADLEKSNEDKNTNTCSNSNEDPAEKDAMNVIRRKSLRVVTRSIDEL